MAIKIGTIKYEIGDETFESGEVKIIKQSFHEEPGGYKEPNDNIETVTFQANSEHGIISGEATARRSGFDSYYEFEDIEMSIDNKDDNIDLETPNCTIEEDEED